MAKKRAMHPPRPSADSVARQSGGMSGYEFRGAMGRNVVPRPGHKRAQGSAKTAHKQVGYAGAQHTAHKAKAKPMSKGRTNTTHRKLY